MNFEFNFKGVSVLILLSAVMVLALLMLTSGCVTMAKEQYREYTKTPVPTPTPPTPTPTPIRTIPTTEPPYPVRYVDPYMHGERWEGQWFKWLRHDVQGINGEGTKDLHVGVVAYRHQFYDKLTWWNGAMGNYYSMDPEPGNRYFVVWVHEEMFGTNATNDPSMWIFDDTAFRLQVHRKDGEHVYWIDSEYNRTNLLKEFENKPDYYNVAIAPPFGYYRDYTGHSPETAGWEVFQKGYLRMGKGNSCDGYMIFQIPKDAQPEDILLLGNFATFGSAYWRFIV